MAQRHILELIDDLDGGAAEETVGFGLDGRLYEIDLSAKNAEKLRDALATYENAGRRVSGGAAGRNRRGAAQGARSTSAGEDDSRLIREWAAQHGHAVNSRGRIPAHVRQAYESR